ncbi:PEP-CTERM sorting domain-containing protein [Elioraea rosea]|uniref:PEP-CTERM sorting domain-containing protein n=1 Tax=Elioraea rosea TaxID=2492390 RepID=UPI001184A2C8|nr:PEP-CTERM sorting domain-containing protein [Elioraea rosea]
MDQGRTTFLGAVPSGLRGIVAASALLLLSPGAQASIATVGCANVGVSCTSEELNLGASITVNDLRFSGFFFQNQTSLVLPLDAPGSGPRASLLIVPLDQTLNPWGFSFPPATIPTSFLDSFSMLVDALAPGLGVSRVDMVLRYFDNSIGQYAVEFSGRTTFLGYGNALEVTCEGITGSGPELCADHPRSDATSLFPVPDSVRLVTELGGSVTGEVARGIGDAGIVSVQLIFNVPEPSALIVLGVGLLGLGLVLTRAPREAPLTRARGLDCPSPSHPPARSA